jgi:hypothetical protein
VRISGNVRDPLLRVPALSAGLLDAVTARWSLASDRNHACILLESRPDHERPESDRER